MSDEQTPGERLDAALLNIKAAAENIKVAADISSATSKVQAAMGWMWRGDLSNAHAALLRLPPDRLREVSAAGAALSALADEIAAEQGGTPDEPNR